MAVEERSDSVSGAASCAASETESDTKQLSQVRSGAVYICAVAQSQKDSELLSPYSIQSSVVNHRGGFDFWYLLIHSFHSQASDTCHRDKTEAAFLDDSPHRFPQLSTRLPCTTETFQMEDKVGLELPNSVWDSNLHHHGDDHLSHDHVEAFGRVNCLRDNSFLFSFHCQQHSPHTVLHAMFWDASRHRLGQPSFAPSDNINEACACLQVVQEARDCSSGVGV